MRIVKWGKSLAVRIPATVVEALKLKPGDDIEIAVVGTRAFGIKRGAPSRELLASLRKFRGRLPVDFSLDRSDANGREK